MFTNSRRDLILAQVVNVRGGVNVMYPACKTCYAKLLLDSTSQRYICVKCGQSVGEVSCMMRYRLSLLIADNTALCSVTIFGTTLDNLFGTSAPNLYRMLEDFRRIHGTDTEELLNDALVRILVGKMFYFGFKSTNFVRKDKNRNICIRDLLNWNQNTDECSSRTTTAGLVALQMLQVCQVDSKHLCTVIDVLQLLLSQQSMNSSTERSAELSVMKSDWTNVTHQPNLSDSLNMSEESGSCSQSRLILSCDSSCQSSTEKIMCGSHGTDSLVPANHQHLSCNTKGKLSLEENISSDSPRLTDSASHFLYLSNSDGNHDPDINQFTISGVGSSLSVSGLVSAVMAGIDFDETIDMPDGKCARSNELSQTKTLPIKTDTTTKIVCDECLIIKDKCLTNSQSKVMSVTSSFPLMTSDKKLVLVHLSKSELSEESHKSLNSSSPINTNCLVTSACRPSFSCCNEVIKKFSPHCNLNFSLIKHKTLSTEASQPVCEVSLSEAPFSEDLSKFLHGLNVEMASDSIPVFPKSCFSGSWKEPGSVVLNPGKEPIKCVFDKYIHVSGVKSPTYVNESDRCYFGVSEASLTTSRIVLPSENNDNDLSEQDSDLWIFDQDGKKVGIIATSECDSSKNLFAGDCVSNRKDSISTNQVGHYTEHLKGVQSDVSPSEDEHIGSQQCDLHSQREVLSQRRESGTNSSSLICDLSCDMFAESSDLFLNFCSTPLPHDHSPVAMEISEGELEQVSCENTCLNQIRNSAQVRKTQKWKSVPFLTPRLDLAGCMSLCDRDKKVMQDSLKSSFCVSADKKLDSNQSSDRRYDPQKQTADSVLESPLRKTFPKTDHNSSHSDIMCLKPISSTPRAPLISGNQCIDLTFTSLTGSEDLFNQSTYNHWKPSDRGHSQQTAVQHMTKAKHSPPNPRRTTCNMNTQKAAQSQRVRKETVWLEDGSVQRTTSDGSGELFSEDDLSDAFIVKTVSESVSCVVDSLDECLDQSEDLFDSWLS